MFHNEEFLRRIDSTSGSKQVAINGSHWMTYGEPAKDVINEIEEFMAADTATEDDLVWLHCIIEDQEL